MKWGLKENEKGKKEGPNQRTNLMIIGEEQSQSWECSRSKIFGTVIDENIQGQRLSGAV